MINKEDTIKGGLRELPKDRRYGFLPDKLKQEDYCFGGFQVSMEIIQEDGQWDKFLPEPELQKRNGFETYNCTVYGTINCLEVLLKKKYSGEYNKSERYIGVMAGTSKYGNTPQQVIEIIRKEAGLIDEKLLPFNETIDNWDEYYSPKPMKERYIREGKKWLKQYEVKHEWIFDDDYSGKRQEILKEALRYSPIGISVYAWKKNEEGLNIKDNELDNHWVTLYGYKDGEYWKIFDHYNNTFKKLIWSYKFGFAKRYYLEKRPEVENGWFQEWLKKIINFIKKMYLKIRIDI